MAEIKSAIVLGDVEAVLARLGEEGLSCKTWNEFRAHVSDSGSSPVVMGSLQKVLADAALKHAVRANDIDTARQALLCGAEPEGIASHAVANAPMRALLTYARHKNKLYPTNGPHGPETALDCALRNGLEEGGWQRAKALLRKVAGNKTVREAWRDAVKGKQADVQRAILLLGYPDQDRGFRLLQEDAVTDPGVMAVMKEFPYFSPKRGLLLNFNGQAMFHGTNKKIACNHLVEHRQAKLEQSERRKFDYVQYDNVQNIAAHVSDNIDAKYKHLKAHAAETHLFHNHDFGKVLIGQFGEMQRKKETARLLLLTSSNHAMSVELKVKDKGGKPRYVAALFDPNTTTSHIRFASDDMRTLEGRTLKGFLESESTYEFYYPDADEISIMYVRPPAPAQAQAEQAGVNRGAGAVKNRTLTSCIEDEQLDGAILHRMLVNGFSGDIRRLKNEIAKRSKEEGISFLAAKRSDGMPGLYWALQDGHADTIRAFGEVLVELKVPLDKCAELLEAKRADGVPGLYGALHNGHADAIRALGEVLKGLQMPPDKCIDLLAAKRVNGVSGLYGALHNGHADAIRALGEVLKGLQLPPDKCIDLLAPQNHISGLFKAAENGHADAIAAFGKVLKELQVPPDKCIELLTVDGGNGVPGLSMALQNGQQEAAEQYIQIVKKIAPELDKEQRAALLKEIRKSHARKNFVGRWSNFEYYKELKKNNPDFYQRFKEMKNALK